uniref:CASAMP N-terminal domain-containing protein n=1 Tax=Denticeps clupeoides TaxID=299321 RepID=A0AAY3ZVK5_9TELE
FLSSSAMVDAPGTRKSGAPPDIQPLERYEAGRAKIRASLRWLLAAAYGCGGNCAGVWGW